MSMPSSRAFGGHHREQLALGQPALELAPLRRACSRRGRARSARPGRPGRRPPGAGGRSAGSAPRRGATSGSRSCARRAAPGRRAGWPPRRAPSRAGPSASFTSGGFHIAIRRSARGEPSRSTSVKSSPVRRSASSQRVGDRGAREHEARLGAVGAREPAQAAEHVGHVGAEHAAVHVGLVHHDPGEVGQHVAPGAVVGQHPHVEHVRVREDEVRAPADRGALLLRRVAVVDRLAQELQRPVRASPRAWSWASALVG